VLLFYVCGLFVVVQLALVDEAVQEIAFGQLYEALDQLEQLLLRRYVQDVVNEEGHAAELTLRLNSEALLQNKSTAVLVIAQRGQQLQNAETRAVEALV